MSLDPFPDAFAPEPDRSGGFWRSALRALRPRRSWAFCAASFIVGGWMGVVFSGGGLPRPGRPGAPAGPEPPPARVLPGLDEPVRDAPAKPFGRNGRLPPVQEREASGQISPGTFSPARDLVFVDDGRCWWESEHDGADDDECDHSMHAAAEMPFRRLVNLLAAEEPRWQLRVQEAYRPGGGIHSPKSMHSEGRALDLTLGLPGASESFKGAEGAAALETLAALAWRAGFDWVFLEFPRGGGPHVHASVRADAPRMRAAPDGVLRE